MNWHVLHLGWLHLLVPRWLDGRLSEAGLGGVGAAAGWFGSGSMSIGRVLEEVRMSLSDLCLVYAATDLTSSWRSVSMRSWSRLVLTWCTRRRLSLLCGMMIGSSFLVS